MKKDIDMGRIKGVSIKGFAGGGIHGSILGADKW
jgi:hypothetical protein